jgi:hypothetical protein
VNLYSVPDPENPTQFLASPVTGTIIVSPIAYKFYDPAAEYEALTGQLAALAASKFPDLIANSGGQEQWTLTEGGVYVTGDGAEVTYTDGGFEIKSIKLEKDYSYGVAVNVTSLVPLTGALTGTIIAVAEPRAAATNNFIDYPESVRAPLAGAEVIINQGNNVYGPFTTGTDGSFTADKLPSTGILPLLWAA